ncbi:MAG: lantibiotic transport system permease protein [Moorella sp. (in: firmicutes)]|nr:lantibiotic transport system permease protein [Moorella sp. (in: firmicutes)]
MAFLGSRLPRSSLYLGKLATITLLSMTSIMLGTVALLTGIKYVLNIPVKGIIFIMAASISQLGAMPLLAFHLWVGFARGMGASIGLGGAGVLIASLMATSLGNTVWPLVPWAWPVRLSMLPGIYLPGVKLPPPLESSGFFLNQSLKGIIPAAVFFTIMLLGGLMWFERWEGRKVYD